jgi:hypothetical protein
MRAMREQNIANGVEFKKEAYMIPFNDFVTEHQTPMNAFLDAAIAVQPSAVQVRAITRTRVV